MSPASTPLELHEAMRVVEQVCVLGYLRDTRLAHNSDMAWTLVVPYLNSSMRIAILGGVIEQRNTQDGFAGLCDTMTGSDTRICGSGLGWDSVQTLLSLSWDTDKVTGAFDRKQFDV